jgi:hypothetical protein
MLYAWLVSNLSRIFGLTKDSVPPLKNPESDRPLEQIINEGSHGTVEEEGIPTGGCYSKNPWKVRGVDSHIKTQAEQDYDFLKSKAGNKELIVISDTRYNGLLKLAYINEEADKWINGLQGKADFVLVPGVVNIGIVRC